jgi:hypothetical protein
VDTKRAAAREAVAVRIRGVFIGVSLGVFDDPNLETGRTALNSL